MDHNALREYHRSWLDKPDTSRGQRHDSETILKLLDEIAHYRTALADIYNRIPCSVGSEPIVASGLCYDINEMALNGLKGPSR